MFLLKLLGSYNFSKFKSVRSHNGGGGGSKKMSKNDSQGGGEVKGSKFFFQKFWKRVYDVAKHYKREPSVVAFLLTRFLKIYERGRIHILRKKDRKTEKQRDRETER
jgi:hypothetical protein